MRAKLSFVRGVCGTSRPSITPDSRQGESTLRVIARIRFCPIYFLSFPVREFSHTRAGVPEPRSLLEKAYVRPRKPTLGVVTLVNTVVLVCLLSACWHVYANRIPSLSAPMSPQRFALVPQRLFCCCDIALAQHTRTCRRRRCCRV